MLALATAVLAVALLVWAKRLPADVIRLSSSPGLSDTASAPPLPDGLEQRFEAIDTPRGPHVLVASRAARFSLFQDGDRLATGGRDQWQGTPTWHVGRLRPGSTALLAVSTPQAAGWPEPLVLLHGPSHGLQAVESRSRLLDSAMPRFAWITGLAIGGLLLVLWVVMPSLVTSASVGFAALAWAGFAAAWTGVLPWATGWAAGWAAGGAVRGLGVGTAAVALPPSVRGGARLALASVGALCLGLAAQQLGADWTPTVHVAGLWLTGFAMLVHAWRLSREAKTPLWLIVPAVLLAVAALGDGIALVAQWGEPTPLMSLVVAPVWLVAMAWWCLAQFVDQLRATQAQNRALDALVREKTAELDRQYAQMRALENQRVLDQERQRILGDMHDGVGGHLVSTIALVESQETSREAIGEALRDALTDLRLMVDSLDEAGDDLNAVLANFRVRMEPRLRAAGLALRWQVRDLPPMPGLGPARILQVLRVLQEAVTNVMKHARAGTVTVQADADDTTARVVLCDDGVGLGAGALRGHGLNNMQRRADAGGFTVDVAADAGGGTRVELRLPMATTPASSP